MRNCPVCGESSASATLFLDERIDPARLSAYSFASRKTPEFMCHRLVRCGHCDLVYAPQPPSDAELAHAYHQAAFDSAEEAADAADAYIRAIGPVLAAVDAISAVFEIGTGSVSFAKGWAGLGSFTLSASSLPLRQAQQPRRSAGLGSARAYFGKTISRRHRSD